MATTKSPAPTADLPRKPPEERSIDDKGRLKETDVATHAGVQPGQILDKGTPVLRPLLDAPDQEGADFKILQAARPTGSDVPELKTGKMVSQEAKIAVIEAALPEPSEEAKKTRRAGQDRRESEERLSDPLRPENRAATQARLISEQYSDSLDKKLPQSAFPNRSKLRGTREVRSEGDILKQAAPNEVNPANEVEPVKIPGNRQGIRDHRVLTGEQDGSIPGSRVGNSLHVLAEGLIGDKVYDILDDGSHILKIINRDKSRAFAFDGSDLPLTEQERADGVEDEYDDVLKVRIEIRFPGINPSVSQRHVLIKCDCMALPAEFFLSPDVSFLQVLVHIDEKCHIELYHIDRDGRATAPYMIDFYTQHQAGPFPLEASPLQVILMENLLCRIPRKQWQSHLAKQGGAEDQTAPDAGKKEFSRTAGGHPPKTPEPPKMPALKKS